jgi:ABC-type transport system involved in multi-copper enzyme maturation permease subunit
MVIAGRELRDKTRLFLIAAALAVLPFLATLLPTSRGWDKRMIIAIFGGTLSIGLGLGTAIALGVSTIGRELSEKRLSFYFSKPVSPAAIWIGKAVAAIFTALACFAIVGVPALVASRASWAATWSMSQAELIGLAILATVVLFLVSHTLSTMVRSRSALVAIDLMLAVLAAFASIALVRPLIAGSAVELTRNLAIVMGAALLLVLAASPVLQLAHGRADARRNHVALSRVLWPALLIIILMAAGYVAWVVHPSPSDFTNLQSVQGSGGRWIFSQGMVRGRGDYQAAFFYNTLNGRSLPVRATWSGPVFSRDGRVAAWVAPSTFPPDFQHMDLQVARIDGDEARLLPVELQVAHRFILSEDGARLAKLEGNTISVHQLQPEKLLVSAQGLNPKDVQEVAFIGPDLVRIWQHEPAALTIWELDVTRKTLTRTGQAAGNVTFRGISANADASRLLLHGSGQVVDGRTGATLYQVPVATNRRGAAMLSDGTVIVTDTSAGRLRVYSREGGAMTADIVLPGTKGYALVASEIAGGKAVVMTEEEPSRRRRTFIVDLKRGLVERSAPVGAIASVWFDLDPRLPIFNPGVPLTVRYGQAGVALWDLKSGTRKSL